MLRNHGTITASLLMSLDVLLSAVICLLLLHWPQASGLVDPFQQGGQAMLIVALTGILVETTRRQPPGEVEALPPDPGSFARR